jgi:hypothetical protein
MCGKRRAFLSLQVGNDGEHYEPALDSDGANIPSISWWIGPAYHAGGECFDRLAEVVRREAFSAHCGRVASDWSAGCMFSRVTTRGSRDRLKGQPQERQHSAAEGGTRDQFAFVISSQCCACRYTACACSLSQFFTEDDMAKKAKKAKKTAKAATKKVAKKTSKKKK